jgi:CheY-like chemotaxis protein
MSHNVVQLLHVEDDRIQQSLIAHLLAALQDYRFRITVATSEDEAVSLFFGSGFDLVILDYHLREGDGLSCLRRIRRIDAVVPIIAVSGEATDEIAAELISGGADDYLAKQTVDSQVLAQSVRNVISRAQAFRTRFAALAK